MKIKKNSAPLPGEQPLQLFVVRQIWDYDNKTF